MSLLPVIKCILPTVFQEADLFEPFCEQVAALQAAKLQKYLMDAEPEDAEGKDTIDLDEENKEEIIRDFLWELYSDFKKGIQETPDEKCRFVNDFAVDLVDETYAKEPINIPVYNCTLSKHKGGKKGKGKKKASDSDETKVINPLTGSKVTVDGRLFKTLVKDGLLMESGEMTGDGVEAYNKVLEKRPKKISHPLRKGEINLGGKAYKNLLEEGYFYNQETEEWSCPDKEEEETEDEETEDMGLNEEEEEETEEEEDEESEGEGLNEEEEETEETEEEEEDEKTEEEESEDKDVEWTEEEKKTEEKEEKEEKETEEKEEKEEEVAQPKKRKGRKPAEKIPHPKSKSRQIAKGGVAHQNLEQDGWIYNDEEGTWSKE